MAPKKSRSNAKAVKKSAPAKKPKEDPMFPARRRSYRIGGDVMPKKRDLGRYVKWPRYVRIQRQRKILYQRLKVPPAINQFTNTLNKSQATEVFKLLDTYRPETKEQKKKRLLAAARFLPSAAHQLDHKMVDDLRAFELSLAEAGATTGGAKPPPTIKYGLNHVFTLVENKKAKLVIIANDVDPIELVVTLPALCRSMDVPYLIVKNKARLGSLVHLKTAAAVALTAVSKEDDSKLRKISDMARSLYNDNDTALKTWGGGVMGLRTQAKLEKREKMLAAEKAKKAKALA